MDPPKGTLAPRFGGYMYDSFGGATSPFNTLPLSARHLPPGALPATLLPRVENSREKAIQERLDKIPNIEEHIREKVASAEKLFLQPESFPHQGMFGFLEELLVIYPHCEGLASFDAFAAKYLQDSTPFLLSQWVSNINYFCSKEIPLRYRLSSKDNSNCLLAECLQFQAIRNFSFPDRSFYLSSDVVDEIKFLLRNGLLFKKDNYYYHGTGSAALPGIQAEGGLKAAYFLENKNIKTGEFVTQVGDNNVPTTGGATGLKSIYVSRAGFDESYALRRWFNEFPVTFCFDKQPLDLNREVSYDYDSGYRVGPEVQLEFFAAVSAPKRNEAEMNVWIEACCPHVQYVSLEAALVLQRADKLESFRKCFSL